MRTIEKIADEAEQVLQGFAAITGLDEGEDDTTLSDLLAHLLHWARVKQIDFDDALRRGQIHFSNEVCGICGEYSDDGGICDVCS